LNQDLREEHGWSYGAHSHASPLRGVGQITMSAAVITDKTIDALKAMLADVDGFARKGLTDEEVHKTRSQARSEIVKAYEGAGSVAGRLASDAALGLPPDHEASVSLRRDAATKEALDRLAAEYFDPSHAVVVIVGPRAKLEGGLGAMGLLPIEIRDAEGNVVKK
jgi:predicted Zn-dependent peptidase